MKLPRRIETILVVLVFACLAFLVYRDVSRHTVIQLPGPASASTDPPAARAEVQKQCDGAGGCDRITFIGLTPETQDRYEIVVYIVDRDPEQYVVLVAMQGGKVVASKAE